MFSTNPSRSKGELICIGILQSQTLSEIPIRTSPNKRLIHQGATRFVTIFIMVDWAYVLKQSLHQLVTDKIGVIKCKTFLGSPNQIEDGSLNQRQHTVEISHTR